MQFRWAVVVACALVLGAGLLTARAQEKASDAPAKSAAKKSDVSKARLTQPWSKMTSLSEEQKTQIRQIHAKATEEIKAIRDREQTDILALLSDEQKNEAKALLEKSTAERKTAAAAAKTEAGAMADEKADEAK